jgi:hypothetical protein
LGRSSGHFRAGSGFFGNGQLSRTIPQGGFSRLGLLPRLLGCLLAYFREFSRLFERVLGRAQPALRGIGTLGCLGRLELESTRGSSWAPSRRR